MSALPVEAHLLREKAGRCGTAGAILDARLSL
jgi:hypothetical protein